jgi:plasmid stabilization system protein ParE
VIAIFSISLLLTFLLISRFNPEATEEYEQRLSGALTEIADTSKNAQLSESITLPAEEAEPVDLGITADRATQVLEARALVAAIKLERKKPTTEKSQRLTIPRLRSR